MSSSYSDFSSTTTMRWMPEPRVAPLLPAIEARLLQFSALIRSANFIEFLDSLMIRLITDCLRDAGAHEGVIWMLDGERKNLLCAYQLGPASGRLLNHRLPVDTGVASMVLATQQPFCESNLSNNRDAASKLDDAMKVIICSRILVPFSIAGQLRGLVSCYRTKATLDAPEPPGFEPHAVEEMSLLSRLLERLLDHKMLSAAIGLQEN